VIFAAVAAVESADACEVHGLLLAHVVGPAIDGVAREDTIAAELDAVGDHVVVAATVVLDVSVRAHVDGSPRFVAVYCGFVVR
jgi:hypothetical protein